VSDDPEELTVEQTAELRGDLDALIEGLSTMLESTAEGSKPVDLDEPIGRLSRMEAIQQQKMAEATHARAQGRARQARAALILLGAGDYGFCQRCGDPIGYPRLKARPETPLCIVCQSALEEGLTA
jgi:DnaK suppressor protein